MPAEIRVERTRLIIAEHLKHRQWAFVDKLACIVKDWRVGEDDDRQKDATEIRHCTLGLN